MTDKGRLLTEGTNHAHGTADSDKSNCYSWFVCHDKTNEICSALLAQARPMMLNHLVLQFNVTAGHSYSDVGVIF